MAETMDGEATPRGYSFEPLNVLAPLARLLIDVGGHIPQLNKRGAVWFVIKVGDEPTSPARPMADVFKPTKDYFLDMAALAAEVEKKLLEHAENHELVPRFGAWPQPCSGSPKQEKRA